MLRAVIVDFQSIRLFRVTGDLTPDDHSILLLISDWLTTGAPPSIVDFSGLECITVNGENHAANMIVVHLSHLAVRRPNGFVYRLPEAMAARLEELFAVWDLPRPIFF